jgi:hypothetical protein
LLQLIYYSTLAQSLLFAVARYLAQKYFSQFSHR